MKRLATVLAPLVVACALSVLPAGVAAADPVPGDCTTTRHTNSTMSMSCTNRPAGQQWRLHVLLCTSGWVDTEAYGNVVTGNGTSTATCPFQSRATYPAFDPI